MPETPLVTYLRIQRATDRDVLRSLRDAAASVDSELRRLEAKSGVGAEMRRSQLQRSRVTINRQLAGMFRQVQDTVGAAAADAAAAGAESVLRESKDLLRGILPKADYDYLSRSAQEQARRSVDVLQQRVSGSSYVPLADSVYGSYNLTTGKIDEMINDALARGASAAELARDVRAYINPNTPGGVRYAAMRLGRTELNNSFHAAQVAEAQAEPWVTAVQWHLSGSHPVPDECNDYAEKSHVEGGEAGVWKKDEVPSKPHPNCLCYTTPVTPEPEEFVDAFMKGEYDRYLDDMNVGPEVRTAPVPRKKAEAKPATGLKSPYAVNEEAIADAVENVNPNAVRAAGGKVFHRTRGSSVNCQKTSYAAELRMRGLKVVAEDGLGSRYGNAGLRTQWRPRPGERNVRGFSGTDLSTLVKKVEKDPVGSRYIITSTWSDRSGHVYNAVKERDGSLRFFDAQKKRLDVTEEYSSKSVLMEGFRVDNMEPSARHRGIYREEGK